MNDHELDRSVAALSPVRDEWVATLDLGHAEIELMGKIMATSTTRVTFDGGWRHPSRGRRRLRVAVAVGAVAAAALAVVLVKGDGAGEKTTPSNPSPIEETTPPSLDDIRPLIPESLPEGFEVARVEDNSDPEELPPDDSAQPTHLRFYGDVDAEDPSGDLVLGFVAAEVNVMVDPNAADRVTVREHDGLACGVATAHSCQRESGDLTVISWVESSDLSVWLESRSLDADQLLAIADDLVVQGDEVGLGALPSGVGPLTEAGRSDAASGEVAAGYQVDYARDTVASSLHVTVTVMGDAERITWLWSTASAERVGVRGHEGRLTQRGGTYALSWEEAPGIQVEVSGGWTGVTRDDVLGIAERLRAVSVEEWQALLDEAG